MESKKWNWKCNWKKLELTLAVTFIDFVIEQSEHEWSFFYDCGESQIEYRKKVDHYDWSITIIKNYFAFYYVPWKIGAL